MKTSEFANKTNPPTIYDSLHHTLEGRKKQGGSRQKSIDLVGSLGGEFCHLCVMWPEILPIFYCTTISLSLSLSLSLPLTLPSPLGRCEIGQKAFLISTIQKVLADHHMFYFPSCLPFAHLTFWCIHTWCY
jgi:hypothetical protein